MAASRAIKIRQVTAFDADKMMTFLLEHYYRDEPLTVGIAPPEPPAEDKQFLLDFIPHGTCFLAEKDQGNGSRIVGAVIAGPKDRRFPELMRREAAKHAGSKWGRILGILSAVETGSDVCRRFNVPSSMHFHAMGVDRVVRRHGLGIRLMEAVAQRAREQGHRLVSGDATSAYSARMMQGQNYELVHTLRYADHLDANGQQVVTPPPPHESIQTFVLRL